MSTLTTINSGDLISGSRTVINNNFSALNTDKIETSVIDTDTTLAANSDAKIASQKATKAYADSIIGVNASESAKGVVEEATAAQITAGTDTGETGAKLFVPPSKMNTQIAALLAASVPAQTHTAGALANNVVKTYFNVQLLFILWTGAVVNDTTTTFSNWERTSTDVFVSPGGAMLDFQNAGADTISLQAPFRVGASDNLQYDNTNIVIMDWWAKLPSSGTGDINMGFGTEASSFAGVYNDTSGNGGKVAFSQSSAGVLYAVIAEEAVGASTTDISSGLTLTNWNNYRIELDLGNEAKFYVNGTLKATLSGANLEINNVNVWLGFGRSNTSLFQVTAPNMSLQMNP
jgi:hypothetical protein